jgi:integrase/recombinase XerC
MDETIDQFLHQLKNARGASEHTLRAYGQDLSAFSAFATERGIEHPRDIETRTMRAYLGTLEERGLKRASVQRKLSSVRSFLKYLVREGVLEQSPALGLRKRRSSRHLPTVLSEEEIGSLLAAPRRAGQAIPAARPIKEPS